MAWTDIRQAQVGQLFTAPWYNAEIRDNLNWVVRPLTDPLTAEVEIVSSASAVDLLGGLATVPGGALGTSGMLRATLLGDYLNASGSNKTLALTVKLGATTLWADTSNNLATSVNRHDWTLVVEVANCGATNSQYTSGVWYYSTDGGATTGIGDLANTSTAAAGPSVVPFGSAGTTAVDTSVDQTFTVVAQHSASNAAVSIRRWYAVFELVGQAA